MTGWLRRLKNAVWLMRARGLPLGAVLLFHAPAAFFLRAWRMVAQPINGRWINRVGNRARFISFADGLKENSLPRMFVIVMPFTLHFLLPCIALLQGRAQVVLLVNGARDWEQQVLRERFPSLPLFKLWTMPFSSLAHGDAISLLLENHRGNFGLIDHDCYIFDEDIFNQFTPADDEVLLALFSEESATLKVTFPLTYLLFFHVKLLRRYIKQYGIDARLYRNTPPSANAALTSIGLEPGAYLKQYHTFHDTLHLLLEVALADGMKVRYLSSDDEVSAIHIGSTSTGTHHTKGLYQLYIHLRFLELLDDPLLNRRYAFLTAPLQSSSDAFARRSHTDPNWQFQPVLEDLILRLRDELSDSQK